MSIKLYKLKLYLAQEIAPINTFRELSKILAYYLKESKQGDILSKHKKGNIYTNISYKLEIGKNGKRRKVKL